jgi:hypothetical protein
MRSVKVGENITKPNDVFVTPEKPVVNTMLKKQSESETLIASLAPKCTVLQIKWMNVRAGLSGLGCGL